MKEDELAESIKALKRSLDRIYDNGCLFDKLVFQLVEISEGLEKVNYSIKNLSNNLENR